VLNSQNKESNKETIIKQFPLGWMCCNSTPGVRGPR